MIDLLKNRQMNNSRMEQENVLYSISIGLGLSCIVFVCFWPGNSFLNFKYTQGTPLFYPVFFIFMLIWSSHHLMAFGRGEFIDRNMDDPMPPGLKILTFEVLKLWGRAAWLHGLFLPFYLIVGSVCGISPAELAASLSILWLSASICGTAGLLCRLLFGSLSLFGFLVSRLFLVSVFVLSGAVSGLINPVYLFYLIFSRHKFDPVFNIPGKEYAVLSLGLAAVLFAGCVLAVNKKR